RRHTRLVSDWSSDVCSSDLDVDPDILLIDEVLSVGDERFQLKCEARMQSFRDAGKTIVFVSHSADQVRDNCNRAVWIHEGRIVQCGDAAQVTQAYHEWSVSGGAAAPQSAVSQAGT